MHLNIAHNGYTPIALRECNASNIYLNVHTFATSGNEIYINFCNISNIAQKGVATVQVVYVKSSLL